MQFESIAALLSMEGHGVYVWSVYGVALFVLAFLAVTPLQRNRRFFIEESMRQRRESSVREQAGKEQVARG